MRFFRIVATLSCAGLLVGMLSTPSGATHSADRLVWAARYDGRAHASDSPADMAISADGSILYVAGTTWAGDERHEDIATIAYGRDGGRRWTRVFSGKDGSKDVPAAVASGRARVYVTGTSHGTTIGHGDDYVTMAYAAGGDRLWAHRYDGSAHGVDTASDIVASPDGSTVYVTGSSATIAYRSDGTVLWVAEATPGRYLAISAAGSTLFVEAGFTTVAIDAATGNEVWRAHYAPYGEYSEDAGVAAGSDGRVFVAGSADEMGSSWIILVAYGAAGDERWVRTWPDLGYAWTSSLAVRYDGKRIYLAGEGDVGGGLFLLVFDPSGRVVFRSFPWFQGMGEHTWLSDIAIAPDGENVYLAGDSGAGDFATFGIGASGKQRWGLPYDGPGHRADFAASVVVSPDGSRVFVTGISNGMGTGTDISTIAYSAG